jgi:hypothetical protein
MKYETLKPHHGDKTPKHKKKTWTLFTLTLLQIISYPFFKDWILVNKDTQISDTIIKTPIVYDMQNKQLLVVQSNWTWWNV